MMPSRSSMSALSHGPALDPLLTRSDNQAVDEDSGSVNALRIELADLDELLDLGDRDLSGRDGHGIEVPRRLPVDEVAEAFALPGRDHREVAHDAPLEKVIAAVEAPRLFALGHERSGARRRVERGDAGAAGPHPLREGALRHQLDLELAREELPLELGVLS